MNIFDPVLPVIIAMDLSQTQPLEQDNIPETVKSNPDEQVACLRMLSQKGLSAKCLPVFGEKNVIGSNKDVCHIHIPSRAVSNRHAVIDVDGHTHLIYDLHSLNHTYRGKMFLRPDVRYEIRDKDLLSFADIICQYFIDHKHEEDCRVDEDFKHKNNNTAVNELPAEEDRSTAIPSEKTNAAHVLSDSEPDELNDQPVVEKSKTYSVLETPCRKTTPRKSRTEDGREKRIIEDSHSEIADTDSNTRDDVLDQSEEESRTDRTRKSGGETFNWANMQTQLAALPCSDTSDKEDQVNGGCVDPLAPTQLFAESNSVSQMKQCDYDAPTQLFDKISDHCEKDSIASNNADKKVTEHSNVAESDEEEDMLQDLNVRNERAKSDEICKNIENELRSAIEDDTEMWAQLETQDLNSDKSLANNSEANIATQKLDLPETTPEKRVPDIFEAPTQLIALPGEDNNEKSRKPDSSPEIRRSSRVPKKKKVWDGDGEESSSSSTGVSSASHAAKKNADRLQHSVLARSESRSVSFGETSGDRTANSSAGESSGISRKRIFDSKGESDEESHSDLVIDTDAQTGRVAKVAPAKRKRAVNDEEFTRPKTLTRVRKAKANFPDDSEWISPKKRPQNASPSGNKSLQAVPKVMFTGLSDLKWTKVIKALGGEITESVFDCSILVTDKIRRTCKLLCSIARGKHIVSQKWLQECEKSQKFIDSTPFLVKDVAAEEKYGFKLSESIKKAAQKPLLDGYTVYATPGVTPDPNDIKTIVECSGGQYSSKMPSSTRMKRNSIVISVLENEPLYRAARAAGVPVAATELLLSGVLRQKLDFKKYLLQPPCAEAETSRTRKARK